VHIVTPNKCAGSGPLERYRDIKGAGAQFRYEATVGAGLPVIASDHVGAAHDLLCEGENGFTFSAGDANALAAAMLRYAANPDLARAHGEASSRAAADWTPARGAERWAQALHTVCAPQLQTPNSQPL
jgi:aspartokinase/homoserine dehydrogenase 1